MKSIQHPGRAIVTSAVIAAFMLTGCGESETDAERAERLRRKAEDNALLDCREAVRSAAKFPSEADFPWNLGRLTPADGGGYLVVGDVKLMNAFGAMIPHRYVCDYKGGRAEVVAVRPR